MAVTDPVISRRLQQQHIECDSSLISSASDVALVSERVGAGVGGGVGVVCCTGDAKDVLLPMLVC